MNLTARLAAMAAEYTEPLIAAGLTATELELVTGHRIWLRQEVADAVPKEVCQAIRDAALRLTVNGTDQRTTSTRRKAAAKEDADVGLC